MADSANAYSLAAALRETGFTASVVTTFNAYLPFYEEFVLRRLVASGCTNNVVLMDARQCAQALSSDSTRPRRAGVDYTLVPVSARGAFHPKLLLRLGKHKGSLFVGSHNLTVAGFGMNDELTNRFEYDAKAPTDSVGAFASVAQLLRDIISTNAEEVAASVHAALEAAPWLDKLDAVDDHVAVMGTRMSAPSIWDQVRQRLPARVHRVLVIAPFFDQGFDFVRRIQADLDRPDIVIGLDPDTADVDVSSIPTLSGVRFVDVRGQIPSTGRREGVTPSLHAKAMVFAAEDADFLVTGSANASGAACLAPHRQRNTECVVLRRIDRGNEVLSELGLRALSHAPDVSEAEWKSMSIRLREDAQEADWDGADAAAILAVVDGDRFRIDGTSFASDTIVRALDADGTDVGRVSVVETGPPVILNPDVTAAKSAAFLIMKDDHRRRWAIVHRPISIAEHYSSDTRRALRQAIGSLGDDPAQLEVLLKLSEKVIFDDDGQIEKNDTQLRRRAGQKGDAEPDS